MTSLRSDVTMRKPADALRPADRTAQPLVVRDESVTVSFSGDLTAQSAPMMRLHLLTLAADDGPGEIIVALSNATWIAGEAADPLLGAHRRQAVRGAVLRLSGLSPPVTRFLRSQPRIAEVFAPPLVSVTRGRPKPAAGRFETGPDRW